MTYIAVEERLILATASIVNGANLSQLVPGIAGPQSAQVVGQIEETIEQVDAPSLLLSIGGEREAITPGTLVTKNQAGDIFTSWFFERGIIVALILPGSIKDPKLRGPYLLFRETLIGQFLKVNFLASIQQGSTVEPFPFEAVPEVDDFRIEPYEILAPVNPKYQKMRSAIRVVYKCNETY